MKWLFRRCWILAAGAFGRLLSVWLASTINHISILFLWVRGSWGSSDGRCPGSRNTIITRKASSAWSRWSRHWVSSWDGIGSTNWTTSCSAGSSTYWSTTRWIFSFCAWFSFTIGQLRCKKNHWLWISSLRNTKWNENHD